MSRLYGIRSEQRGLVLQHLEKKLGRFESHESLYLGEYELYKGAAGERIQLRPNTSPVDGEFAEPDHPTMEWLLFVDGTSSAIEEALRSCEPPLILLREY